MEDTQLLSDLIGSVYDAALDPGTWPRALEQMCGFVGGVAGALFSQDAQSRTGQFYSSWGDDPAYTRSYFEKYIRLSPLITPIAYSASAGRIDTIETLLPYEEYRATRFYQEWAKPQGYVDVIHATLDKSATSFSSIAVSRHERDGRADAGAVARMRLVAPHAHRAVAIGRIIDVKKVEAAALGDTLDGLAAGLFLLNDTGAIVYANQSGQTMIGEGNVMRESAGKLVACDAEAQRTLADIYATASQGDAAVGIRGVAVPLPARDGEPHVAHVLPLASGARRLAGAAYAANVALFVKKASLDLPSPVPAVAQIYHLTPAELRVLLAIVEIGGVPAVAPVLGMSEATVKTHLHHVYEKTDTSRQADLVKLVAGVTNPLAI